MGYVNDNDPNVSYASLPGDSVPINPNLPPGYVMAGLGQSPVIPGSLTSPPYSYYGNSTTMAGQAGNGFPIQVGGLSFPPLPNSLYFNTLIGGGGGGGGTDHRTEVAVASGGPFDFLSVAEVTGSGPNGETIVTYTIDYDGVQSTSNFNAAVNECVSSGTFRSFQVMNSNNGSVSATTATDNLFLLGDWSSSVDDGSQYLKTVATQPNSQDTITFSFERFLPEKITADSGGILESGKKGGILKIEGGDGITTKVQAADLSSEGSNKDLKVVAEVNQDELNQVDILQVTSVGSQATLPLYGAGTNIDLKYTVYGVRQISLTTNGGGAKAYNQGLTGELYDFSRHAENLPTPTGVNPQFTFQTLEVGTVLTAKRFKVDGSPYSGTYAWATGGIPTLDFSCT